MHRTTVLLLAAALSVPAGRSVADQSDSSLVVRAVRFYRAEQKQTRVKGLVQIPLASISAPEGAGPSSYLVTVRLADSTGLTLYQQSWRSRVMVGASSPDAYTVEIVDFAIAPGEYRLEVAVQDSISGRQISASTEVDALSDTSQASDLLIAPQMRLASSADTLPKPGEFRAGTSLVTAAAQVIVTPLRTKVFYLLEAYTDREANGTMAVSVVDSGGKTVVRTPPVAVAVAAGGSILKGQIDLSGLPPGQYAMVADLRFGDRSVKRSADLVMAPLGEALARDTTRRATERVTDEGYFASLAVEDLQRAEAPLTYIARAGELSAWSDKLTPAAKRRFLTQFWIARDPTPGTPRNERREAFYESIDYANRTYREGGRNPVAGWRSDRGRIYAKYGAPEEILRRQQEGRAPPYEVWRYATGKGSYYIFADRSGFGAYTLIYSNDLKEPGLPGWAELLGTPAVEDASRFLGVDLIAVARQF
jgi:GWxTD domain-containing protein